MNYKTGGAKIGGACQAAVASHPMHVSKFHQFKSGSLYPLKTTNGSYKKRANGSHKNGFIIQEWLAQE